MGNDTFSPITHITTPTKTPVPRTHTLGVFRLRSVQVLDVGTGGGLPGLPLAICYPNVNFTLIDGTRKKIAAVADMAERLGLANVRAFHVRAEEVSFSDFMWHTSLTPCFCVLSCRVLGDIVGE